MTPAAPAPSGPTSAAAVSKINAVESCDEPFTVNGTDWESAVFKFQDVQLGPGQISLKHVLRQYMGLHQFGAIQATQLHLVLGRLRCLQYSVQKYNDGVVADPQPASFTQYWKRHTLEHLSGFGFQVTSDRQIIEIVGMAELLSKMDELYDVQIQQAKQLAQSGLISFDGLGELYRPDVPVKGVTGLGGTAGIFMVTEMYYQERRSLVGMEKSFHITFEYVVSLGEHYSTVRFTEVMSGWMGSRARSISELSYVPLKQEESAFFVARGRQCVRFGGAEGISFLGYAGNSFFIHAAPSKNGSSMSKASGNLLPSSGRIMVDSARGAVLGHYPSQSYDESTNALMQAFGRYRKWKTSNQQQGAQDAFVVWSVVPEEFVIYCWPAVVGFSFTVKAWGHVLVSGLHEINFNEQAFDQLVLPKESKQLIRALVKFGTEEDNSDIIEGKCGGSIFLLHGPPGCGKTLTAEAIAEVLHRPLYYVTMGELGTHPTEIENRLGDVLELCAGWNAITILDEADVFLETRSSSDILRNAMVCVMLRLLEYHSGILFLTTNRVRSFDPAFESRVTIALKYDPLTSDARKLVWQTLVSRIKSVEINDSIDFAQLAGCELNGRQIKNAVRLAVALAKENKTDLNQTVLEATLKVTSLGRNQMKDD